MGDLPGFCRGPADIPTVGFRPKAQRDAKRERDAFYSSARWMRFRRAYLFDNPLCLDCLAVGRYVPAIIPHHIKERLTHPELAFDEDNLIPLCNGCHTHLHKAGHATGHANGLASQGCAD